MFSAKNATQSGPLSDHRIPVICTGFIPPPPPSSYIPNIIPVSNKYYEVEVKIQLRRSHDGPEEE
jgi:hypothetical protein